MKFRAAFFGKLALAVVALGAALPSIQAATVTYDATTTPAVTNIPYLNTELSSDINYVIFPKWNPADFAGYHLTGVQITLNGQIQGTISLTNNGASSQTTTGKTTVEFTTVNQSGYDVLPLLDFLASLSTGSKTVAAHGTYNSGTLTSSVVSGSTGFVATTSNLFKGTDTYHIGIDTSSFTGFTGGGGQITATGTTQAKVLGSVTYTYEAGSETPEPASFVLLGSALAGVGLLRRRKAA